MKFALYTILIGLLLSWGQLAVASSLSHELPSQSCPTEERLIFIDGDRVSDMENIHSIFVSSLNLPEYYGRNLDALYDVLMDVDCPTKIYIVRGQALQKKLGESSWQRFFDTLCEAIDLNRYLTIEYWD